jgi:magnesium chelatase subunit I
VEDGNEEQIIEKFIQAATVAVFNRHFNVVDLEEVVTKFKSGVSVEVGDTTPSKEYVKIVKQVDGLDRAVAKLEPGENVAMIASGVEFVLEGLHLNKRLNKDRVGGRTQYRG